MLENVSSHHLPCLGLQFTKLVFAFHLWQFGGGARLIGKGRGCIDGIGGEARLGRSTHGAFGGLSWGFRGLVVVASSFTGYGKIG